MLKVQFLLILDAFISSSSINESISGYSILGFFFSLRTYTISLYSLIVCKVSIEKTFVKLIVDLQKLVLHFFLIYSFLYFVFES